MSPYMKVFRWLLSHLTLIIVILMILYFYWSWGGEQAEPTETVSAEVAPGHVIHNRVQNQAATGKNVAPRQSVIRAGTVSANDKKINTKHVIIESAEPEPDPQAFSERMRQYQLKLSREDQEKLSSYNRALQARAKKQTNSARPEARSIYPDEQALSSMQVSKSRLEPTLQTKQKMEQKTTDSDLFTVKQVVPKSDRQQPIRNNNLQEQIRSRQKQLSHQMISLLSTKTEVVAGKNNAAIAIDHATTDSVPAKNNSEAPAYLTSVKEVVPVIKTVRQKRLLAEAREAFERGQYGTAEEKYLRLAAMLPELLDVMGELANVYKTQNRISDYVASNTRFVKRLAKNYRFKEAWIVVSETAEIDKNAADKQRRIINKTQKLEIKRTGN